MLRPNPLEDSLTILVEFYLITCLGRAEAAVVKWIGLPCIPLIAKIKAAPVKQAMK